jgi:hypothetical protein
MPGNGFCYANSDIRQERKISEFDDWTPAEAHIRRNELITWIIENWGMDKYKNLESPGIDIEDEDDIEINDTN